MNFYKIDYVIILYWLVNISLSFRLSQRSEPYSFLLLSVRPMFWK